MRICVRVLLVLVLPGLVSCAGPQGGAGAGNRPAFSDTPGIWPFWPTRMRIHPLTRVTTDESTGRMIVETRIEFLDAQGVTSKAVGHLALELVETAPSQSVPNIVEIWNQDLRDPMLNQRQFDVVTRTYLFRLELDRQLFPQAPQLNAFFVSMDGQKLDASMKIKR